MALLTDDEIFGAAPAAQPSLLSDEDLFAGAPPAQEVGLGDRFMMNLREGFKNNLLGSEIERQKSGAADLSAADAFNTQAADLADAQSRLAGMAPDDPRRKLVELDPAFGAVGRFGTDGTYLQTPQDIQAEAAATRAIGEQKREQYLAERLPELQAYENTPSWYEEDSLLGKAAAGGTALAGQLLGGAASPESLVPVTRGATVLGTLAKGAAVNAGVNAAVDPLVQQNQIASGTREQYSLADTAISAALGGVIGGGLNVAPELIAGARRLLAERRGVAPEAITPDDVATLSKEDIEALVRSQTIEPTLSPAETIAAATGVNTPEQLPAKSPERRQTQRELADVFNQPEIQRRSAFDDMGELVTSGESVVRDGTGTALSADRLASLRAARQQAERAGIQLDNEQLQVAANYIERGVNPTEVMNTFRRAARSAEIRDVPLARQEQIDANTRKLAEDAFRLAEVRRQRREADLAAGNEPRPDYQAGALDDASYSPRLEQDLAARSQEPPRGVNLGQPGAPRSAVDRITSDSPVVRVFEGEALPPEVPPRSTAAQLERPVIDGEPVRAPEPQRLLGQPRPAESELDRALAMSEDDYIRAINPEGKTISEDDKVLLSIGDIDAPRSATDVNSFKARDGSDIRVVRGDDGAMYAKRGDDVLGEMRTYDDGETVINVVQEAQGQGIGRGLAAAYIRENPFAQSGGFSPAGEANRRSAFRQLQAERAGQQVDTLQPVGDTARPSARTEAASREQSLRPERTVAGAGGERVQDQPDQARVGAGPRVERPAPVREEAAPAVAEPAARRIEGGQVDAEPRSGAADPEVDGNPGVNRRSGGRGGDGDSGLSARRQETPPAAASNAGAIPEILTLPKKQYIARKAKEAGLKKGSPGYAQAVARLESEYAGDADRASAGLSFEQFNALNSESPEGVNRSAWQSLRDEFGVDESKDTMFEPGKLYDVSGALVDATKYLAKKLGGKPEDWKAAVGDFKSIISDLQEASGGLRASNRNSQRSLLTDIWRGVLASTDGNMRVLAGGFDSPTLKSLPDEFFATAGRGDGVKQTFGESVEAHQNPRLQEVDKITADLRKANLADKQDQIIKLVENPRAPRNGTAGAAARRIEQFFKDELKYMRDAGVEVGEVKDGYFPRSYDSGKAAVDRAGFLDAATRAYMKDGASREDAGAQAVAFWESIVYGVSGTPGFRPTGGGSTPSFIQGRAFSKEAADLLSKFRINDIDAVMAQYVRQSTRRAEIARRFGDNWSKWGELEAKIKVEDPKAEAIFPDLRQLAATSVGIMPSTAPSAVRQAASALRTITTLATLSKAAFASLGELTIGPMRASTGDVPGDIGGQLKGLFDHLYNATRTATGLGRTERLDRAFAMAEDLGIIAGTGHNSLMAARFANGDPLGRTQSKILAGFFRNNGLEYLTNYTRATTVLNGQVMLRRLAKQAASGKEKRANFFARELGVPAGKEQGFLNYVAGLGDDMPNAAGLSGEFGQMYRTALQRFTDQTVQRPSNSTRPQWANTWWGGVLFQLQSFGYAFQKNFLNRQARILAGKNDLSAMDRVMFSASMLPQLALLVGAQQLISQGMDEVYGGHGKAEKTEGAKLETALSRAGLFGVVDPYIQSLSGVRYQRSPLASFLGPALGGVGQATSELSAAALNNSENTNTAERNAAKAAYTWLLGPLMQGALAVAPLAGPAGTLAKTAGTLAVPAGRDAFVDEVAGEKQSTRRKEKVPGFFESLFSDEGSGRGRQREQRQSGR